MSKRIKPGGLLFAVPTGRDKVLFNNARIYGRLRLLLLMAGGNESTASAPVTAILMANATPSRFMC
jgi:hypothetical protein